MVANTEVVAAAAIGTSVTAFVSIWPSLKPCAVIVTTPLALVMTDATYLVVVLALDVPAPNSQPQPFAAGAAEAFPD